MEFIETTKNEADKAAWLEKRKHYITGTDAGKLIGVSPYGSTRWDAPHPLSKRPR